MAPYADLIGQNFIKSFYEINPLLDGTESERIERFRLKRVSQQRLLRLKSPSLVSSKCAKRRAIKHRAVPVWANMLVIKEIYAKSKEVTLHTGIVHHVDHIVPLKSRLVCGLHCEANLQIIPAIDNQKKKNSWWPDMTIWS